MSEPVAHQAATAGVLSGIASVMAYLAKEGVAKDSKNQDQGYKFRGIDAVMNALAPAMVRAGLIAVPAYDNVTRETVTLASGKVWLRTILSARYTLIGRDGSQLVVGPFPAQALDNSDKGDGKAMSYAYRAMAIQLFCIPTEGDHDTDASSPELGKPAPVKRTPENFPEEWEGAWTALLGVYEKFNGPLISEAGWQKIADAAGEHGWKPEKVAEIACSRLGCDGWGGIYGRAGARIMGIFTGFEA